MQPCSGTEDTLLSSEQEALEPLIRRFSQWYLTLSPHDQNAAFLMTSGLADAMAKEESRYSPDPGFLARYVAGSQDPVVAKQNRTYGAYNEHASRLKPPLAPTQLAVVAYLIFVAPFHQPRTYTNEAQNGSVLNNP